MAPGDGLDLAPDAQEVAAPDLGDLLLGVVAAHELSYDVGVWSARRQAEPSAKRVARPGLPRSDDVQVVPPTPVKQILPPFPAQFTMATRGVLELVINQEGAVESAIMRESINPRYDPQILAAARSWQYRPATLDGAPVKYRKMMQVDVKR